jgi:hypothetical protein
VSSKPSLVSARRDLLVLRCGVEFGRILTDLLKSERPDLMSRSKAEMSFLSFCCDPELQTWSAAAQQKAVQIIKRGDGKMVLTNS